MSRTEIIAELGSLAEGRQDVMLRQISAAADAGCDAVKAQWVSSPARLVERRKAQAYAGAYANIAYSLDFLPVMREHAEARGLEFGCSVYIEGDAAKVAPFVDFLKVSSFEALDVGLRRDVKATGKLCIVSVGMLTGHDEPYRDGFLSLHCVSAYPAPMDACNLSVLRDVWGDDAYDGFSDHTANFLTGAFAVCAGARIVEFHLRLDDSNPASLDYSCALSPSEAKRYVDLIRLAELAMGDGTKKIQACELPMAAFRVTT
jgi:N,N'-diacetyllegionaminate synthase